MDSVKAIFILLIIIFVPGALFVAVFLAVGVGKIMIPLLLIGGLLGGGIYVWLQHFEKTNCRNALCKELQNNGHKDMIIIDYYRDCQREHSRRGYYNTSSVYYRDIILKVAENKPKYNFMIKNDYYISAYEAVDIAQKNIVNRNFNLYNAMHKLLH